MSLKCNIARRCIWLSFIIAPFNSKPPTCNSHVDTTLCNLYFITSIQLWPSALGRVLWDSFLIYWTMSEGGRLSKTRVKLSWTFFHFSYCIYTPDDQGYLTWWTVGAEIRMHSFFFLNAFIPKLVERRPCIIMLICHELIQSHINTSQTISHWVKNAVLPNCCAVYLLCCFQITRCNSLFSVSIAIFSPFSLLCN